MIDSGRIEAAVAELLAAIGEDATRPGLAATPRRVAEAYAEFFAGLEQDPLEPLRAGSEFLANPDEVGELVLLRDIEFRSICEHHLLPFLGVAHVAYLPGDRIVGLSRLPEVVEILSARPQLQERLGEEIASALEEGLGARGVLVVLDARHSCVTARGSRQAASTTVTVASRGELQQTAARAEAMALIGASSLAAIRANLGTLMADLPQIMGVLNVTPDSFSDGGAFETLDAAVAHATGVGRAGASIVDVGGESTRPGAQPVDSKTERARVIPVVRELVARGIPVSIDTRHADVALSAIDAGAQLVNDVTGGLGDEGMARVIAETGVHYVVMHWREGGADAAAHYRDVVAEVRNELKNRIATLIVQGVQPEQIVLDPGLGFAKNTEHNWALLGHLEEFGSLGHGLLIGASRKRFVGKLLAKNSPMEQRDAPTAVISALAARAGVWAVRVHDVPSTRLALSVVEHWQAGAQS